jgi:hypothetical protein
LAGQESGQQSLRPWPRRRRRQSRQLKSHQLHLTIEEPEPESPVEYTDDEMPEGSRRALHESD